MITEIQKITALSKTPLFAGWDIEYLQVIAENSNVDSYEKEAVIFNQNQKGDRFYLILEGDVVILSPEDNTALAEFVAGEMFGETAVITGQNQNAIATANEQSVILSFPKGGQSISEIL